MTTVDISVTRFAKRCVVFLTGLLLLVSTVTPAFSQVRVSGASKSRTITKKSRSANSGRKNSTRKAGRSVASDEIISERLTVEPVSVRTTAEIMDEQAARGNYKSPREILR